MLRCLGGLLISFVGFAGYNGALMTVHFPSEGQSLRCWVNLCETHVRVTTITLSLDNNDYCAHICTATQAV